MVSLEELPGGDEVAHAFSKAWHVSQCSHILISYLVELTLLVQYIAAPR